MKVIKPKTITSAMLASTTATEAYSAWAVGTAYALNARVFVDSRIYECIQGPSTGNPPATSLLWWMDVGPANKWAMFDTEISTQTSAANTLTVVLKPGICNSLSLFGLDGYAISVTVRDGLAGPVVYSYSQTLDGTLLADWYQYYFEPDVPLTEVILTDLPPYADAHITVSITGVGDIKCGVLTVGTFYDLGDTQYGATASIIDYSRKTTSATGITTFERRAFSKRMSVRMMLPNAQLNKVQSILADVRATPCVWLGTDASGYNLLGILGFYRDFSLDVAYPTMSYCSLEVEGLT